MGLGRHFHDRLYKMPFFRASERICPVVFKLSVSLSSVTSVPEKANAASAYRLEQGCSVRSPAEGSLPKDSLIVGKEKSEREATLSTTVAPALLIEPDCALLLSPICFPASPPIFNSTSSNIPKVAKETFNPIALTN